MTPVSMVVYWMMILWIKEGGTCVNGGLLNDDTLIKLRWYMCQWLFIEWWYFDSNKCVNSGLLNDDTLIKANVSIVVYWMMILWLKQMCQ